MSFLSPARLLCCLLKMQRAWQGAPRWMASDVLWLNQIVIMKSPLALPPPSALCQPQWPFQAFRRPVGLFPAWPEEGGEVRGGGGGGGGEEAGKVESESRDAAPGGAALAAPSLPPASAAPCWRANSCKNKGQRDNLDKYLIVTVFTSPCLTRVTSGAQRAGGERLQPLLVQGEQAAGQGGAVTVEPAVTNSATSSATSGSPCRASRVFAQEELLPPAAQTHLF